MKVIVPITVDNTALISSNITEDDHAEWLVGTTYADGDRVIVTGTTHKIYESVAGSNTGNDPTTDSGAWWAEISATNRWKAFDGKIADQSTRDTSIIYSIRTPSNVTGVGFFGLVGKSLRVQVFDTGDTQIYDRTVDLIDGTDVVDWLTFFTEPLVYDSEALLDDLPAYAGYRVDITIFVESGNTAGVGEIVLGRVVDLGTTLDGTGIGFEDFSTKDRDVFGNAIIIERAFSDTVDFQFSSPTSRARQIKRQMTNLRATPAVWYPGTDMTEFGATVFGYVADFNAPLSAGGLTFYSLKIEGLT